MQTVISGATFGGANAILLPIGVLWLMGRPELVPIMMLGAFLGLVIDATILYQVFDSKIYPATGLWPAGVATAECLIAGDRGGKRARLLGVGGAVGGIGQLLGYPMDVFGVCWIGNIWALSMFGLGLLVRGYSPDMLGVDLDALYVPHGVMIGAGTVALCQILFLVARRSPRDSAGRASSASARAFGRGIGLGFLAFVGAATILALLAGLYAEMSPGMLLGFVLFAALAALVSELIVGISAMHAGWFPAFATSLIFLVLGMIIKAGWILRGSGRHPEFERQGRRQQYFAELVGVGVAAVVILLSYKTYFSNDLFPPVDRVYAATIAAGTSPALATSLLLWAVPGAIVQLVGGPARQLGILFATGLLIYNPAAGWTAVVALAIRAVLVRRYGNAVQSPMYVLAGGFIAGSALTSFGAGVVKAR
jgi:uncharacterized oligopeptide transporter (OPT) family protein